MHKRPEIPPASMRSATCRRIAYCYRRVGSTIWCLWINSFRLLLFANLHFLHNIAKIGKFISFQHCETLIHAFITSKLGYCKSILSGLSKNQTQRLQYVQNSAARLLIGNCKYDNITPLRKRLQWLPVAERINYKILLLRSNQYSAWNLNILVNCYPFTILEEDCVPLVISSCYTEI